LFQADSASLVNNNNFGEASAFGAKQEIVVVIYKGGLTRKLRAYIDTKVALHDRTFNGSGSDPNTTTSHSVSGIMKSWYTYRPHTGELKLHFHLISESLACHTPCVLLNVARLLVHEDRIPICPFLAAVCMTYDFEAPTPFSSSPSPESLRRRPIPRLYCPGPASIWA
jgi:hypothetical protein